MNRVLLFQAIDEFALQTPNQPAVRHNGAELSYAQLSQNSNQIAHHLLACGVKRGDRVGIYLPKGLNAIAAAYGIMKAGAAYVPLDPLAPIHRVALVIEDCDIQVVVTGPSKQSDLEEVVQRAPSLKHVVGIDVSELAGIESQSWDQLYSIQPKTIPDLQVVEDDLAYILYTSGSTGVPKGIMHTHRSGLSFAEWAADCYGLVPEDIISNHAPMHFDLSTFDYFASHIAGATTVIIPEAITKFPANMAKLIEDEGISVWYSVPFALIQILLRGGLQARDLSSLRWLLFAGEPFPTKHLRSLMAELPNVKFSNLYGPTETNVCTFYHLPDELPTSNEPIPIGIPCRNIEAVIVDENDDVVPPGQTGELLIRGGVVMRGYWGQPKKTRAGFYYRKIADGLEHAFYRTGDLVSQRPDGNLMYYGRKDRQVKTRGYRVELDEIETSLMSNKAVEQVAVYTIPDGEGSNIIQAAAVLRSDQSVTAKELLDYVAGQLPPYAVPVSLQILEALPRTSTGKIDRVSLAARAQSQPV